MSKPDIETMQFRDAVEGDDMLVVAVDVERVATVAGLKGLYRFGEGNPVVRYVGHEGEAWSRVYTFELEDGYKVPYDSETLIQRMKSNTLEAIVPRLAPVERVRDALEQTLALSLTCIAATIERESDLKRPNKRILAREQEAGRGLLAALDDVPDGKPGVHRLRELIKGQVDFMVVGASIRSGMSGQSAAEVRRITLVAEELEKGAVLGSTNRRLNLGQSRDRLRAALGEEPEVETAPGMGR